MVTKNDKYTTRKPATYSNEHDKYTARVIQLVTLTNITNTVANAINTQKYTVTKSDNSNKHTKYNSELDKYTAKTIPLVLVANIPQQTINTQHTLVNVTNTQQR